MKLAFFSHGKRNNQTKVMTVLKEPCQDRINFQKLLNEILIFLLQCTLMKMKNDHRSKFSSFSSWKEEAWKKKIRASMGFETVTSTIPMWCSTNWAMKPHIWSAIVILLLHLQPQYNIWVISHNLTSFYQHEMENWLLSIL